MFQHIIISVKKIPLRIWRGINQVILLLVILSLIQMAFLLELLSFEQPFLQF